MRGQLTYVDAFVNSLIDFRLLKENKFQLNVESFNPITIFKQLIDVIGPQANAKGITIDLKIDGSLKAPFEMGPARDDGN